MFRPCGAARDCPNRCAIGDSVFGLAKNFTPVGQPAAVLIALRLVEPEGSLRDPEPTITKKGSWLAFEGGIDSVFGLAKNFTPAGQPAAVLIAARLVEPVGSLRSPEPTITKKGSDGPLFCNWR